MACYLPRYDININILILSIIQEIGLKHGVTDESGDSNFQWGRDSAFCGENRSLTNINLAECFRNIFYVQESRSFQIAFVQLLRDRGAPKNFRWSSALLVKYLNFPIFFYGAECDKGLK